MCVQMLTNQTTLIVYKVQWRSYCSMNFITINEHD